MESQAATIKELKALRTKLRRELEQAKKLFCSGGCELVTMEAAIRTVDELIERRAPAKLHSRESQLRREASS